MSDVGLTASVPGMLGRWRARFRRTPTPPSDTSSAVDDWSLWHRACAGHAPSATTLVRRLTPQAQGLAKQILHHTEDAQDMVQESFLRLWTARPSDALGARLGTYFNTIVINRCKTHLTRRRELVLEDDALLGMADQQQAWQADAADPWPDISVGQIERAMASMLPRQRMALAMWAYADADTAQIARALEIEVNAAHQLLHRAKRALRDILRGE